MSAARCAAQSAASSTAPRALNAVGSPITTRLATTERKP